MMLKIFVYPFFLVMAFSPSFAKATQLTFDQAYELIYDDLDLLEWWYGDDGVDCRTDIVIKGIAEDKNQLSVLFQIQQDGFANHGCMMSAFNCTVKGSVVEDKIKLEQKSLSCDY